jgi:hypothetical protein
MTEEEKRALDEASAALFSSVTQLAVAQVNLDAVRTRRSASPEEIHDAAKDYRSREEGVREALKKLIELQVAMMVKET